MKVQMNVDEHLWRKARVAALERGETLGELVGVALGDFLGLFLQGKAPSPLTAVVGAEQPASSPVRARQAESGQPLSSPPQPSTPKPVVVESGGIKWNFPSESEKAARKK